MEELVRQQEYRSRITILKRDELRRLK